jgi:hydrogenase expression/formation protein HypD
MKHLNEYRNEKIASALLEKINGKSSRNIRIMEVCGGHTMAIRKYGIQNMLPDTIQLLSGPGCPVCVTEQLFIDKAIALSNIKDVIITTYGDLIRVPGSESSLDQEKANGLDIRIVHSTLESLKIAEENPSKKIVFLGIGFETTTPSTAIAVMKAKEKNLNNFFVLSAHKTMPNAMATLIDSGSAIDGYIGPGHVSTIAGAKIYDPLVEKYNLSIAIAGFEPVDILQAIYMLVCQLEENKPGVQIQYNRAVTYEGNLKAQQIVRQVFHPSADCWRGIGTIPDSGMSFNASFKQFDAEITFDLKVQPKPEPKGCLCGNILKGINIPTECKLFGKTCLPENPVGACMVSSEGTCSAYYRYSAPGM